MDEEKLKKRKQRVKKDGNLKQLADIVKELGDVYFQSGRLQDALLEYTEQLELCETLADKLNIALAHRMIGEIHTNLGNYEEALSHQVIYLEGAKKTENLIEQQRAYATLGRTYFCLGEASDESSGKREKALVDAKKAYSKSLKLCDMLENTKTDRVEIMMMRARLLLNLGLVLEVQKEPKHAIELIEKATELCKRHKLNDDLYRIYTALGALYERQDNFNDALKYYDLSAQVTSDPVNVATARVSQAELLTKLGLWSDARKVLVNLYVNHKVPSLMDAITRLLKIVASIEKYELELCSAVDNKKIMKLFENLGDAAAAGLCYEKAVEYYQQMLICAEKDPLTYRKKISAALVSLAQTLMDDKRYEEALVYARRELELVSNDNRETCRSALFLANLLTNIEKSSEAEIRNVYALALSSANNCQDISLQISVLKEMHCYYADIGALEDAENSNKKLLTLKMSRIVDSESSNNSEVDESIDMMVDIDLDELSDVERELQKRGEKSRSTRRTAKRGCVVKRNEKGETKLHVACINNNIDEVRHLLTAGHPVDVRDYCGWTPLHEASNFGHVEIAELLIDHGTNINDPGGVRCGNITPLHDAASCGNFAMMNLLITRGADITLRTKAGETVLDCFENWRSRLEEDRRKRATEWSDDDEKEYKCIRDKLRQVLPATLLKSPHPLIDDEIQRIENDTPDVNDSDNDDDDEHNNDDEKQNSPQRISAGEDYRRTIESLKNRSYLNPTSTSFKRKDDSSQVHTPLIDSEQQLVDDWLEDDLFMPSSRSSGTKRVSSDDLESPVFKKRSINSSSSACFDNTTFKRLKSSDDSATVNNKFSKTQSRKHYKTKQKSLLTAGFSRNISPTPPSPNVTPPLIQPINLIDVEPITRLNSNSDAINFRVIIDNSMLNVKIKHSDEQHYLYNSLTNEIIRQFHQNTGCGAKVTLSTNDGNELQAEHLPNLVYTNQGSVIQLYGKLIDVMIPKLTERYRVICAVSNITITDDVKQLKPLRSCEHTETLRLRDDDEAINMIVLLKTLRYEKSLKILDLSTCCLFGLGDQLNCTLIELVQLQELHLSSCDIDYNCISSLDNLPSQLRILDLSYNLLGARCEPKLGELISSLRFLQILNLRACQLNKLPLNSTTISSSLINLDISWNSIVKHSDSDNVLARQLISLNLSQTLPYFLIDTSTRLIALETLETLELGGCNISDFDVSHLLHKCKNLSKLVLNNNSRISKVSLERLLEARPTLSLIDVTGCEKITERPKDDLIIDNPSICTVMACIQEDICVLWEQLWRGHAKQYRMPQDIVIFKPYL